MASLQVLKYAGGVERLGIPDGPPIASKSIAAGANGTVYGASGAAAVCDLCPIGGDVTVTWPGGVVEVITAPVTRMLRGEAVSVA